MVWELWLPGVVDIDFKWGWSVCTKGGIETVRANSLDSSAEMLVAVPRLGRFLLGQSRVQQNPNGNIITRELFEDKSGFV